MRFWRGLLVLGSLITPLNAGAIEPVLHLQKWRCPQPKGAVDKGYLESTTFWFSKPKGNPATLTATWQAEVAAKGGNGIWRRNTLIKPNRYTCSYAKGTATCVLKNMPDLVRTWKLDGATGEWTIVGKAKDRGRWHTRTKKRRCKIEQAEPKADLKAMPWDELKDLKPTAEGKFDWKTFRDHTMAFLEKYDQPLVSNFRGNTVSETSWKVFAWHGGSLTADDNGVRVSGFSSTYGNGGVYSDAIDKDSMPLRWAAFLAIFAPDHKDALLNSNEKWGQSSNFETHIGKYKITRKVTKKMENGAHVVWENFSIGLSPPLSDNCLRLLQCCQWKKDLIQRRTDLEFPPAVKKEATCASWVHWLNKPTRQSPQGRCNKYNLKKRRKNVKSWAKFADEKLPKEACSWP